MPDDPAQPKLGRWGGPRVRGQRVANSNLKTKGGTSREYILRRLAREGLVDRIEDIRAHRVSAYSIACELGWATRRQTVAVDGQDRNQTRRPTIVDVKSLIG